jgi:hypothetical protein
MTTILAFFFLGGASEQRLSSPPRDMDRRQRRKRQLVGGKQRSRDMGGIRSGLGVMDQRHGGSGDVDAREPGRGNVVVKQHYRKAGFRYCRGDRLKVAERKLRAAEPEDDLDELVSRITEENRHPEFPED